MIPHILCSIILYITRTQPMIDPWFCKYCNHFLVPFCVLALLNYFRIPLELLSFSTLHLECLNSHSFPFSRKNWIISWCTRSPPYSLHIFIFTRASSSFSMLNISSDSSMLFCEFSSVFSLVLFTPPFRYFFFSPYLSNCMF